MGIPSYYKKLSDKIKGLISRSKPASISAFYLDFNCMIYHCARRPNSTLPPYPGDDQKLEWENMLIDDIVRYVVKLWHEVGQPKEVFLGIDGVVPMAKIRQQRLRRFKSIWLADEEKRLGIRENKASWDTNCITPGTAFMNRLGRKLQELCAKRPGWSVSATDEPGEGEHKIMKKLRSAKASAAPIVIYGLDADLILLTMLNAKSPAFLLREDSEMGVVQVNGLGEETYSYFSIDVLKKTIWPSTDVSHADVCEYVAMMSLLGNDFVPHSLTVKIRDDGHTYLLKELREMKKAGLSFLEHQDTQWRISHRALLWLLQRWSQEEGNMLTRTIKKKLQMRNRVEPSLDNKPIEWGVEQQLIQVTDGEWKLRNGWQDVYRKEWMMCSSHKDVMAQCAEYVRGLQWVIDYYTGQTNVNMLWIYSRLIPPLWTDLVTYLSNSTTVSVDDTTVANIQPQEQLAMVLPLESWHLLENNPSLRTLPAKYPHYWPTSFGFFSAGRTHMWECEPLLPILPLNVVRMNSSAKQVPIK